MKEYTFYTVGDIYMAGSHITVTRNIYERKGLYYITWYGVKVQVERSSFGVGWRAVEDY